MATRALLLWMVLAATASPGVVAAEPALVREGRALVESLECNRCHAGAALRIGAAPRERSCTGCHAWIKGSESDPAEYARQSERFPYWERYVRNVESFLAVPDLATSGARLDAAWIAEYVRDPYAIRPGMHERMLRVPVTGAQAQAIAAFLVSARPARAEAAAIAIAPSRDPAHVEEGRLLYERLSCGTCHALGGLDREAKGTAPDLAHVRERMRADDIAAFVVDPAAFGSTTMPAFELAPEEAARLRDYLVFSAVPAATPIAARLVDLPLLARAVAWEEVRERVFGRVCVHCHMDPAANDGEGGPGNTGGLGFAGKKLDLESWEGIARSNVLAAPGPGVEPLLLARLRARQFEHLRELSGAPGEIAQDAAPGMPLALPPLTAEEMQLVRSWVAQGAPGPDGRRAIRAAVVGGAAHGQSGRGR